MAEVRLLTTSPADELRSRFVLAARSLVGSPYRHRGRGPSYDCLGVVIGAARRVGVAYADCEYDFVPAGDLLDRLLAEHMVRLPDWRQALPGDVITRCFRLGEPAKHCGVVTLNALDNLRCVHAQRAGARAVAEVRWPDPHFNRFAYRIREACE